MNGSSTKNFIQQINYLHEKGKISNGERLVLLNAFRSAIDSIAHGYDFSSSLIAEIIDPEIRRK